MLGATQKLGDGEIKASIAAVTTDSKGSPRTNKQALGYVHHLSKRTALYTAFAKLRNSGGASIALGGATAAANKDSTGFDIGLRHAF
jgi:predicted porin